MNRPLPRAPVAVPLGFRRTWCCRRSCNTGGVPVASAFGRPSSRGLWDGRPTTLTSVLQWAAPLERIARTVTIPTWWAPTSSCIREPLITFCVEPVAAGGWSPKI